MLQLQPQYPDMLALPTQINYKTVITIITILQSIGIKLTPHYSPYPENLDLSQYYTGTEPHQHDHIEMLHEGQFLQTIFRRQPH